MKKTTRLSALTIAGAAMSGLVTPTTMAQGADDPIVVFVDDDAAPGGDGLSWATAFTNIDQAFTTDIDDDVPREIRVAQGVYLPPQGGYETFPVSEFAVLGGFAGLGAADPDQRDPDTLRTVLTGDVLDNDPPLGSTNDPTDPRFDDNRIRLFDVSFNAQSAVFDGLVMTRAQTAIEFATLITNCTFEGMLGAPLRRDGGSGSASNGFIGTRIVQSDFDQNIGDVVIYADVDVSLVFERCRFRRNATQSGIVWFSHFSAPNPTGELYFNQCQFIANEIGNSSQSFGAIAGFRGPRVAIFNSLFYGNRVPIGDAAVLANVQPDNPGRTIIQNTVIWNNSSEFGDGPNGAIPPTLDDPGRVIRQTVVEGWDRLGAIRTLPTPPLEDGPDNLFAVLDTPPLFVDPEGPDGVLGTDDDDFTPAPGSPLIDAGTTLLDISDPLGSPAFPWDGAAPIDAAGNPRVVDIAFNPNEDPAQPIDIGPFEAQPNQLDRDDDGVNDAEQIAANPALDLDADGQLDAVQPGADCNANGVVDAVDIATGAATDCDSNGVPDACQIAADPSGDADGSGVLDACEPLLLFVNDDALPGGDGSSWATALQSLDDALMIAANRAAPTEIRVAVGVYRPDNDRDRFSSFELSSNVTIRGGFSGDDHAPGNAESRSDSSVTLLSGLGVAHDGSDVFNVVTARNGVENALVEGVTIADGNAEGGDTVGEDAFIVLRFTSSIAPFDTNISKGEHGGGLYAVASDVTLRNVRFENVRADYGGSAIAGLGQANLTLENVTIDSIPATEFGSQIGVGPTQIWSRAGVANTLIADAVTFETPGDAALMLGGGSATFIAPVLNDADYDAFAILFGLFSSELTLHDFAAPDGLSAVLDPILFGPDVSLTLNQSDIGALTPESTFGDLAQANFNLDATRSRIVTRITRPLIDRDFDSALLAPASLRFESSVVQGRFRSMFESDVVSFESRNSTFVLGGTTRVIGDGTPPVITNSIFESPISTATALQADASIRQSILNNIVSNLTPGDLDPSNFDADPNFTDIVGPDGNLYSGDETFTLSGSSPAIDAGDNTLVPPGLTLDLSGGPRFVDDPLTPDTGVGTAPIVDIGADEFDPLCPGDANGDNTVNGDDLMTVLNAFGATTDDGPAAGDVNEDGTVDGADLLLVVNFFGRNC